MLKCPYCDSTLIWKNGHRKDDSQQYRCKSYLKTFYLSHSKKDKLFPFQYSTSPKCGKSMQIYKIRRVYKMNVNCYILPQGMNFIPSHFFRFKVHPSLITTDRLPSYPYALEGLFFKNVHKRVRLGYNNAFESRYSLFKDFLRAKREFKKFSNIFLYINSWVFIHSFYKDCKGEKYAVLYALMPFIIHG